MSKIVTEHHQMISVFPKKWKYFAECQILIATRIHKEITISKLRLEKTYISIHFQFISILGKLTNWNKKRIPPDLRQAFIATHHHYTPHIIV